MQVQKTGAPRRRVGAALAAPVRGMLMLGLVLAVAVPATAQGTSGTLPDPISTAELLRYARRLELSSQQRQATESFHEGYKEQFRILRESDIAAFLDDLRRTQRAGMIPRRAEVEALLQRLEQLNRRVERVDDHFFDQLQGMLSDEQLQRMPRVRLARARSRYGASQMLWITGQRPPDLSELCLDLSMEPEERQAADPLVRQYEKHLTTRLKALSRTTSNMYLRMVEAMEQRGLTEQSLEDPQKAMEIMESMQEAMQEITGDSIKAANEVFRLNTRSFRRILPALGEPNARALREAFLTRSYSEIARSVRWDRAPFTRALQLESLTDEQRQAVRTILEGATARLDGLADRGMAIQDEFREGFSPFDMNRDDWQKRAEQIQAMGQEAEQIRTDADAALIEALGETLVAQLRHGGGDQPATATPEEAVAGATAEGADDDDGGGDADPFLPGRITAANIRQYARDLALDPDQQEILHALHEEYRQRLAVLETGVIAEVTALRKALWEPAGDEAEGDKRLDSLYVKRRRALDAIETEDRAFFDEIGQVVLLDEASPALARVRLARQRQTYRRGETPWFGRPLSGESSIDLVELVAARRLAESLAAKLDAPLRAYEPEVTEAFRARFLRGMDQQRAFDLFRLRVQRRRGEGGDIGEATRQYRDIVGAAQESMAQADAAVARINRKALQGLVEALPPREGHALRTAYDRRAFPEVYNDETAVSDQLVAALELADLAAEQRRRLNDLAAEYRPAYEALCRQMVELSSSGDAPWMGTFSAEDWAAYQTRQDAMDRLRFDRSELNGRAVGRMAQVLTPEQVKAVGGLPDLGAAEDDRWWE